MNIGTLYEQWNNVKQEWKGNRRLQGVSIIAILLFISWFFLQLDTWRQDRAKVTQATLMRLYDIKMAAKEQVWPERMEAARVALNEAHKKLWKARTEGEAQAIFRDWIEQEGQKVDLNIDRITVEVGAAPSGLKWRPVRADIQGRYQVGAWQKLLEKVNTNLPFVVVEFEQLNIGNPDNQFYRLNLTAWFEVKEVGNEP